MARSSRIGLVHLGLALFALGLLGKSVHVQLLQRGQWSATADRQQRSERAIAAPRGEIVASTGQLLAQSRELVQLEVAPRELRDAARLRRLLVKAGIPREWALRATDRKRKWVTLPGRFAPTEVAAITAMRGVHATTMMERAYADTEGARRIVGRVSPTGAALDGIELALDSLLRGTPGSVTMMRDGRGRSVEAITAPRTAPRPGHTVVLTLNGDLQEIAERALADAVSQMGADGGDIVVLDPHDGAVLAMAGRRSDPRSTAATALSEPFEPGSTLKPFMAAGLLMRDRVRPTDSVDTFGGIITINGRTIRDVHRGGRMSLAEVMRWSSNVGIVQFAQRLAPREQFETLRDFGFGIATGVPYPAEASGVLRAPASWSRQSPQSLAMGYEISVTPLQLAAAYAAFANGGELLQPSLVREVRDPEGRVRFRHGRRVVRRVMTPEVAERMRAMLVDVVQEGTAIQADLGTFAVAGKTGTARRIVDGRYAPQQYYATFVGLFPADAPQFVILVKLDSPSGDYYGGTTAAPVTRAVLQAAVAARDAALDRRALATRRSGTPLRLASSGAQEAGERLPVEQAGAKATSERGSGTVPFVFALPDAPEPPPAPQRPRQVPDVRGLALRDAVRALHGAGFRVTLVRGGVGMPAFTTPAPGMLLSPETPVRLHYQP